MHAREGRQADVAGRLGLLDRACQRRRARGVVTGLALRPREARDLVGLGLLEPEPPRDPRCATEVTDRVIEAQLDARELTEHRVAAHVQPRVVDLAQPVLDAIARRGRAVAVEGRDRRAGGEELVRRLVPRAISSS